MATHTHNTGVTRTRTHDHPTSAIELFSVEHPKNVSALSAEDHASAFRRIYAPAPATLDKDNYMVADWATAAKYIQSSVARAFEISMVRLLVATGQPASADGIHAVMAAVNALANSGFIGLGQRDELARQAGVRAPEPQQDGCGGPYPSRDNLSFFTWKGLRDLLARGVETDLVRAEVEARAQYGAGLRQASILARLMHVMGPTIDEMLKQVNEGYHADVLEPLGGLDLYSPKAFEASDMFVRAALRGVVEEYIGLA